MAAVSLRAWIEVWPIAGAFTISRGSKREAVVVVAEVSDGEHRGIGECVPYPRYGQTPETTLADIAALGSRIEADRDRLLRELPPSAARNAIDCALWDLEAKRSGRSAHALAGLPEPTPILTCYTLSLQAPEEMAAAAKRMAHLPLLKLKLGDNNHPELDALRMRQVRQARPDARLVADANEGWRLDDLPMLLAVAAECGVETVEQPLPAADDAALSACSSPVPLCADESAHATEGLASLVDRYSAVNIKLDKTGGLTEAFAMLAQARRLGLRVMIGSMVATSLSMAPALLVAAGADWADLDGPLLLARDRVPGLQISDGRIMPAGADLWG